MENHKWQGEQTDGPAAGEFRPINFGTIDGFLKLSFPISPERKSKPSKPSKPSGGMNGRDKNGELL